MVNQTGFFNSTTIIYCPHCNKKQRADLGEKLTNGEIKDNCPEGNGTICYIVECDKCEKDFVIKERYFYSILKKARGGK